MLTGSKISRQVGMQYASEQPNLALAAVGSKVTFVGNRVDLAETFELHAAGKTRVEREAGKLKEVNEAFDQVEGRGESSPGVRPSVKEQQEVSYQRQSP